jgi:glyoxylase-like metal-dependent hydrolase (beta-lactamase superfamily II)
MSRLGPSGSPCFELRRTKGVGMLNPLSIDVFNSGYKQVPGGPGWDDSTPATWPATTSTLIAAGSEAILVDALMTTNEGERLAAWVRNSGKQLRTIFVTHGHADHFFGAGPILAAFPEAQLVASDQQVVDEANNHTKPESLVSWNTWFSGQFPDPQAVSALAPSQEYDLEGHSIVFQAIGPADGAFATIVRVPELGVVCSGDIVYNNIHMWLWQSTRDSRAAWLASLDAVAALEPATIITGHKDPDAPDDDAARVLDQSRRYIEDFESALERAACRGNSWTRCWRSTRTMATGTPCSRRRSVSSPADPDAGNGSAKYGAGRMISD